MSAPEVVSNGVGSRQEEGTIERESDVIRAEQQDEALPEDPEKADRDTKRTPEGDTIHPENPENLLESVHEDPEKEEVVTAMAAQDRTRARAEKEDEIRPLSQVDPNVGDPSASSDFMGEDATTVDGMESTVDGLDDPKAAPIPPVRPPLEKLAQKNPKAT